MADTSEPSITTTVRSDKSLFMRLLQLFVRPFGTYLISPKGEAPAGSPRLGTKQSAAKGCSITERNLADCWIYDLHPNSLSSKSVREDGRRKKRIYYFAGGGWQMPPSSQHWSFCAYLAHSLPSATISIVSYPLAPKTPAPSAFPMLSALYSALLSACNNEEEEAIFVGDSAGNVVLSMTLTGLRKLDDSSEERSTLKPRKLLLVSPAVDLTNENPTMKEVEKKDPMMNVAYVTSTADAWRGSWDAADPRLSPVKGDLTLLAKAGVQADACVAGWDVLAPDALVLKEKLQDAAVQGQWLVWGGHDALLALSKAIWLESISRGGRMVCGEAQRLKRYCTKHIARIWNYYFS